LEVVDISTSNITSSHKFTDGSEIRDIVAIDDTHFLLADVKGLLKTSKNQLIKHYHEGKSVRSLCQIIDRIYLVGFEDHGLIVWDEESDKQLFKISHDKVFSIKRVKTANSFIIKTERQGVKVLIIDDLKLQQFSLKILLEANEDFVLNYTDSL
jgi:Neuraminidase (sialidase)